MKGMLKIKKENARVDFGSKLAKCCKENQKLFFRALKSFRKPISNMLKNIIDKSSNINFKRLLL